MERLQLPFVGRRGEAADISCTEGKLEESRSIDFSGDVSRRFVHVVPEDRIFHRSPMVVLSTDDSTLDQRVKALLAESPQREWDGASRWLCFRRKPSVRQRDGHCRRLKGLVALEELLRVAEDSDCTECAVYYCGQVRVGKSF